MYFFPILMNHNITNMLKQARLKVREDMLYYHYKNPKKYYRVYKLAINEADHRIMVVYTSYNNYEEITWVRPLDSWLEYVGDTPRFSQLE